MLLLAKAGEVPEAVRPRRVRRAAVVRNLATEGRNAVQGRKRHRSTVWMCFGVRVAGCGPSDVCAHECARACARQCVGPMAGGCGPSDVCALERAHARARQCVGPMAGGFRCTPL